MKTTFWAVLLSGIIVVTSPGVRAQALGDAQLQQMSQALNLTADQKEKLRPILLDEASRVEHVRNDSALTPKQKASKELEVRESFRSRIDAELSPRQLRQMRELRQREEQRLRIKAGN